MKPETERYVRARKIEAEEITGMLDEHKVQLLELGAPGRLLIAGEIEAVLPLDDPELLDRANPVTPDGKVVFDATRWKEREDAQMKTVLEQGAFSLAVLGGRTT